MKTFENDILNGSKSSIDEFFFSNFDHFRSNLTPFDPRRDFRFGPRGEIFFLKHCQKSIDSDFLSRKHLKTTLNDTKCSIDEKIW